MAVGKRIARLLVGLFSLMLIAVTALPLSTTDAWWIRVLDFPRVQIAVLILLAMLGVLFFMPRRSLLTWLLLGLLGLSLADHVRRVVPYTPLVSTQLVSATAGVIEQHPERRLRVMVCNLQYSLDDVGKLFPVIGDAAPDVIVAVEYTSWWARQFERLEVEYPYRVEYPREDGYGMVLLSRFELVEPEVRFLVAPDVPSIRTRIRLPSGALILLYGMHPKPPGLSEPGDADRQDSGERDAELLVVAGEVADASEPAIVAGDFNDVAWSYTSGLFQRMSGLLDPRLGRGIYNTFNAHLPILRYPLDHVFVSEHFRLVSLERLPAWGSDHFPILIEVLHAPPAAAIQEAPLPDQDDREQAEETLEEER